MQLKWISLCENWSLTCHNTTQLHFHLMSLSRPVKILSDEKRALGIGFYPDQPSAEMKFPVFASLLFPSVSSSEARAWHLIRVRFRAAVNRRRVNERPCCHPFFVIILRHTPVGSRLFGGQISVLKANRRREQEVNVSYAGASIMHRGRGVGGVVAVAVSRYVASAWTRRSV